MKKIVISKLFLYRHRFVIGYAVLGLVFAALLFLMPFVAQSGLSDAEIESATSSYYLGKEGTVARKCSYVLAFRLTRRALFYKRAAIRFLCQIPS